MIGSGLSLAAAIGLAWVITDARAVPAVEALQPPPDWPIVFTLPRGFSWMKATRGLQGEASPDGMRGSVAYVGKGREHGDVILIFSFAVLPEGTAAEEAMLRLSGQEPQDEEPISVGPLTGTMAVFGRSEGLKAVVAAACSDRGLAIAVEYATLDHDPSARLLLREVCRSIKYKDWSIRQPKDEFFFPE